MLSVLDLLAVDGRLIAEVETVQALDEGEARELSAHGDVLGGLRGNFLREDLVEEVGVGALLGRGVLEQGLEALAALEQPEPLQVLLKPLDLRRAHRRPSAPARPGSVLPPGATRARGAAISVSPSRAS